MINQLLTNSRLKSLLWRTGMMALAFIVQVAITNLTTLNLSPEVTVFVGLILGEISKAINNYLSEREDTQLG